MKGENIAIGCAALILLFFATIFVGGFLVSLAWNETMPYIFELPQITWQQGVWLAVLGWFLIKGTSTISSGK